MIRKISESEFEQTIATAKVLTSDKYGEKVFLTKNNRIVKLLRRKRLISSAMFYPYALRFANNAKNLQQRGFDTITVEDIFHLPSRKSHGVVYTFLEGISLRDFLAQNPSRSEEMLICWAEFLSQMHHKGIYFRSIHFGNILILENEKWGLIDFANVRFKKHALSPWWRARNFKIMSAYKEDYQALSDFGIERFVQLYLEKSGLSKWQRKFFYIYLSFYSPKFYTKGKL